MHRHTAEIRSYVSQRTKNLTFWRRMDFTGRWRFAIRVWLQLDVRQNKKHRKTFIETHTLTICDDKRVSRLSCEEEGRRCNTPITSRIRIRKQWGCLMVSFRLIGGNMASLLTLCQEWVTVQGNQKCDSVNPTSIISLLHSVDVGSKASKSLISFFKFSYVGEFYEVEAKLEISSEVSCNQRFFFLVKVAVIQYKNVKVQVKVVKRLLLSKYRDVSSASEEARLLIRGIVIKLRQNSRLILS